MAGIVPDTRELEPVATSAMESDISSPEKPPEGGTDSDRMLIAAIAQSDQAAFRELHFRYHRRIARFVSIIIPRCEVAEEITNDTLWIVWQSAGRFQGASKVSTWIMGIAYRVGVKALRRSGRQLPSFTTARDVGEATHDPWSQGEIREWVAAALARLPDEQRKVLELAYDFGHSCAEIAQSVNCPVGTVKTRMRYGRQKLQLLLPQLAGSPS